MQKMLLVTRIGLLCILAFNITAAANVFSQAFNLKMKNVTLEEVLLEIQKKSSFDIICNSEQISNIKNLSVKVENANVEEILKQCLKGIRSRLIHTWRFAAYGHCSWIITAFFMP